MSKSVMADAEDGSQVSHLDQLAFQTSSSTTNGQDETKYMLGKPVTLLKKRRAKQLKTDQKRKFKVSKRYFTAGSKINETNKKSLDTEPSPFSYPRDMDELAHRIMTKAWRNDVRLKELKIKYSNKASYKGKQNADLLNRLYIEEPKVEPMKTVLDIDPQYFKVIEGRPIPDTLSIQEYIQTNRECLRTRIINGYRQDDIKLIEENLVREQSIINNIQNNYQKYVNIFEEFLYEDHSSAMKLLKTAELTTMEAYDKHSELKAYSKKYGAAKTSLYNSEQKWRNCKLYQKFLFNVSPVTWRFERRSHMSSKRISIYMKRADEEDESDIFGTFRKSLIDMEPSLTKILEDFREEVSNDQPPEIYFTEPNQLIEVFQYMQMQNLNSLLYAEKMADPLSAIKEAMKNAEKLFDEEIRSLEEEISLLEVSIQWEENRAEYLEELGKQLLNNDLKEMITDSEILNLNVFVEDVYETRIGPNDANLTMLEMMKAIEERYRNELLSFDKLPSDQIALLEGNCYVEQMKVMHLAEIAAKEYAIMEKLTYRLTKAFEQPFKKAVSKETKKRSPPIEKAKAIVLPPRSLTNEEEEYLEYFTDFCKYTDDPKNYGIDTASNTFKEIMRRDTSKRSRFLTIAKEVAALEDVIIANA